MEQRSSEVGPVVDVGTASSGKVWASALGYLFLAAGPGLTSLYVLIKIGVDRANGIVTRDGSDLWIAGLVAFPMLLVAWPIFATAVRRLRAVPGPWYLRVGAGGIAYRLPGRALWKAALFNQSVVEGTQPWSKIAKWYPFVLRMNGLPTTSEIVFVTRDGWTIRAGTLYFSESREEIVANINRASP